MGQEDTETPAAYAAPGSGFESDDGDFEDTLAAECAAWSNPSPTVRRAALIFHVHPCASMCIQVHVHGCISLPPPVRGTHTHTRARAAGIAAHVLPLLLACLGRSRPQAVGKDVLFRGLRVRMSVATGSVEAVRLHSVTHRAEYVGEVLRMVQAVGETPQGGQVSRFVTRLHHQRAHAAMPRAQQPRRSCRLSPMPCQRGSHRTSTSRHTSHCITLHHTASHCITLHHTASHCITQIMVDAETFKGISSRLPELGGVVLEATQKLMHAASGMTAAQLAALYNQPASVAAASAGGGNGRGGGAPGNGGGGGGGSGGGAAWAPAGAHHGRGSHGQLDNRALLRHSIELPSAPRLDGRRSIDLGGRPAPKAAVASGSGASLVCVSWQGWRGGVSMRGASTASLLRRPASHRHAAAPRC
jgi:uncharacterized membrane protein YgcG